MAEDGHPRAGQRIARDSRFGHEQARPRIGFKIAGVPGELRDEEQRLAGVVRADTDERYIRSPAAALERAERGDPRSADQATGIHASEAGYCHRRRNLLSGTRVTL